MSFIFSENDWKTPNTYNANFGWPPCSPGVYLLTVTTFDIEKRCGNWDIQYVGSSKKLINRYRGHPVLSKMREQYNYCQFYFRECDNYLEEESRLIKEIQPILNKRGK